MASSTTQCEDLEMQTLTLPNLLSFHFSMEKDSINIPQEIGVRYREFGILLLEDGRGNLVESIIHEEWYNGGVLAINLKILQRWLNGAGRPATWAVLIEVLRDIELSALADDIDQELNCNPPD